MKKGEGYKFTHNDDKTEFYFDSIGPKGIIPKVVRFEPFGDKLSNLAFGDAQDDDDFDDQVVSDNDDMRKVLQTIVNIVHFYLEAYPGKIIQVEPVDRPRKYLYNRVFQQKWEEIRQYFKVVGCIFKEGIQEPYSKDKLYDVFYLKPIHSIFLTIKNVEL